jgi:uncharacterized protein HemY
MIVYCIFDLCYRYDLAELYMKLKNYEKAEKVIRTAMEQQKGKACIAFCDL